MVNTKDQSNVIAYYIWYLVCWHCRYKDQSMQCIECYVCRDCQYWCLWLLHNTLYRVLWGVKTLYKVASHHCQEGRLFVTVQYLKSLLSWGFSCSPVSLRRQLCQLSWTCQTTRMIAGKMHSQSPIHKTKGALSNWVILTYLWEQSCILHTLTKLPACNLELKSVFSAWRPWACIIPLEVAGSVSHKVGSHEQVDLPIHRFQLWMLGCQLTHTRLSLIARTWPIFDQSRSLLLVSLLHSYQKDWSSNFNVICMLTLSIQPKHVFTQWNLRANWSTDCETGKKPPKWVIVSSRVDVSRDQRVN